MILKYFRDEENNPLGVVMAPSKGNLAWSMISPQDKFCKKTAKAIAMRRYLETLSKTKASKLDSKFWISNAIMNSSYSGKHSNPYWEKLVETLEEMEERSGRYYKEDK